MSESSDQPRASEKAESIASEAERVRERIRQLVVDTVQEGKLDTSSLRETASEVLTGAERGVRHLAEDRRGTVFAETLEGLTEGLSSAANAASLAFEEAEARGQHFAEEDVKKAVSDLEAVQNMLTDSLEDLARRVSGETQQAATDLITHAKRAADAALPSVNSALDAARRHPASTARDAAGAGIEAARQSVGALFQAVGGLVEGAREGLSGRWKDSPDE